MKKQYILALLLIVSLSISVFASSFPDDYKGASVITGKTASSTDIVTGSRLATAVRGVSSGFGNHSYINGDLLGYGAIFQIKDSGDSLEGAEYVKDVIEVMDKGDLSLLNDGVFSAKLGDYKYDQTLKTPGDAASTYEYARGVPYDYEDIPASYMLFPKDAPVYEYTASFLEDAVSDIDSSANSYKLKDFEDGKITLLGKEFIVLKAEHPAADSIKLTLLSGHVKDAIKEGEKKDYVINGTMYSVEAVAITDTEPFKVKFKVNGVTIDSLGEQGSEKVGSLYITVSEIIPNEAGDVTLDFVEFYLDSYQLELSDEDITSGSLGGKEYKINGKTVEDTDVEISGVDGGLVEGAEFKLSEIYISWTPDEKHYLNAEKYMSEIAEDKNVLFGDLDYYFYGSNPNNDAETIELVNKGNDRYTLSFENTEEERLDVPFFILESGAFTRYGTDDDELVVNEDIVQKNDYFLVTTDGYDLATKAEGLTKLYRYKGQDVKDDILTFFDVGANQTIEFRYSNNTCYLHLDGDRVKINVTQDALDDGDIIVDLNNDGVIDPADVPVLVTKYKTKIWLDTATFDNFEIVSPKAEEGPALSTWAGYGVTEGHDYTRITVGEDDDKIDVLNSEVCLTYNYDEVAAAIDPATSEFLLQACYDTFTVSPYTMMFQVGETDVYEGSDSWGHFVEWNKFDNSPDKVYIAGVEKEDETLFYVIGKGASFYLKEDDEEAPLSKDTVLMGGPCVNEDTAKAMGLTFPSCGSSIIKKDSALIKEYPYNGGKALVVFGYESADTINAVNKLLAGLTIPEKGLLIQGDKVEKAPDKIGEEEKVVVTTTTTTTTTTLAVVKGAACSYPSEVKSEYVTDTRKFGMGAKTTTYVKIKMDGLNGKLDLSDEEPFDAAFGVDWLDFTVHILKDSCSGQEVQTFKGHQVDGQQTFIFDVKFSEPGCYCVKIEDKDLIIDSAKIKIIPDGKFEMMFGAE